METDHKLLKQLAKTRRGQTYFYPLLGSIIVMALFWLALWKWGSGLTGSTTSQIALAGLLAAVLVFYFILRATRRNLHQTAVVLDGTLDVHNQLEAMVELKDTQHPLRVPQAQRASQELGRYKPAPWSLLLCIAGLLLFVEMGGMTRQLFHWGGKLPTAEESVLPEPPKADDFAELQLTKPESELRLKPMDEVAWEGTAQSSNGFDDLCLAIYLNGEPVANLPIEGDALGKPGDLAISGSFYLDELDATPFDVISYHLVAHSKINENPAMKVVCIPHFVQVRPFREDAEIMPSMDPKDMQDMQGMQDSDDPRQQMINILNMIYQVLEFELTLNKAVFAAQAAGLPSDNPVFLEQVGILKQEQRQLKDTLEEFLAKIDPELLTPNMTVSLRAAEDYMDEAAKQLQLLAPDKEEEGAYTL